MFSPQRLCDATLHRYETASYMIKETERDCLHRFPYALFPEAIYDQAEVCLFGEFVRKLPSFAFCIQGQNIKHSRAVFPELRRRPYEYLEHVREDVRIHDMLILEQNCRIPKLSPRPSFLYELFVS
jgi:hypothetical protein